MRNRFGYGGYTIVEILVVVAIMGILAALLFAAGRGAMEEARKSACASSMEQLSKATAMYLEDHDGKYPSPEGIYHRTDLAPYLKSSIPQCPSVISDRLPVGYKGYAFNEYLVVRNWVVQQPARTAVIWESRPDIYEAYGVQGCDYLSPESPIYEGNQCGGAPWHNRHNGVGNVAFADGHIKSLPASAFRPATEGHMNPGDPTVDPTMAP